MPAKLERCVKHVKGQGKGESSAYAICSKSTGIIKKKGGKWGKKRHAHKESVEPKIHVKMPMFDALVENVFAGKWREDDEFEMISEEDVSSLEKTDPNQLHVYFKALKKEGNIGRLKGIVMALLKKAPELLKKVIDITLHRSTEKGERNYIERDGNSIKYGGRGYFDQEGNPRHGTPGKDERTSGEWRGEFEREQDEAGDWTVK